MVDPYRGESAPSEVRERPKCGWCTRLAVVDHTNSGEPMHGCALGVGRLSANFRHRNCPDYEPSAVTRLLRLVGLRKPVTVVRHG